MKLTARQRGVALVELAISILVMVSIAFGITEFGRAIYQYNALAKGVRDAARFLSTRDATDAAARDQAKCLAVYGNLTCVGNPPLVPGLTVAMVNVCDAASCPGHALQGTNPVINLVTVSIGGGNATPYTFNSLVSFVVPDIPFGPISVTMKQVL